MAFVPHPDVAKLDALWPTMRQYQDLAARYGIDDVFQDNGGRVLQVLLLLGLTIIPGKDNNHARDKDGNEYQIRSINIALTKAFSTHSRINPTVIQQHRLVPWIFAVFEEMELLEIYLMPPEKMETLYARWEAKWKSDGGKDVNNPKITLAQVRQLGGLIYNKATSEISS